MKVKEIPNTQQSKKLTAPQQPEVICKFPFGKLQAAQLPIVIDHREQGRTIMVPDPKGSAATAKDGIAWKGMGMLRQNAAK